MAAVDQVACIAGVAAAVAAGIVVTALSGGAAGPAVAAALSHWGVLGVVAGASGAVARVGMSELLGGQHYESTGSEGALDALGGSIDGIMTVVSAGLAARFTSLVGLGQKALASEMTGAVMQTARGALAHTGRRIVVGGVEGAIDGLLSGAVGELVLTLADRGTWDRGVWDALCDIGAAVLRGGATGLFAGGVMGGAMQGMGGLLEMRRVRRVMTALDGHVPASTLERLSVDELARLDDLRRAIATGDAMAEARALGQLDGVLDPTDLEQARTVFRARALDRPASPTGATGPASGRPFDPANAGGPVRPLDYSKVRITSKVSMRSRSISFDSILQVNAS